MFRTSNPLLTAPAFSGGGADSGRFGNFAMPATGAAARPTTMTLQGAVNASMILLGITIATGLFCFSFLQKNPGILFGAWIVSGLFGVVATLTIAFKPRLSPFAAPFVAIAQGVFAGAASIVWTRYAEGSQSQVVGQLGSGLVLQAALLTAGIAGGLLVAYSTRLIKPSENFKLGVAAATMGLCFFSLAALALSLFGIRIPYIWDNGPIGMLFAGAIVVLAALNLVLDFDFIENAASSGQPKYMEWYAAIGLLVTLVWLYVSLLRLLAMMNRKD